MSSFHLPLCEYYYINLGFYWCTSYSVGSVERLLLTGTNLIKRTAFYQLLVVLQCRKLGDGSAGWILIGLLKAVFERVQRLECFAWCELVRINFEQRLDGAFVFRFRRK